MRPLHWSKLPQALIADSVWASVDVSSASIDTSETEALFAVPQPKPKLQKAATAAGRLPGGRVALPGMAEVKEEEAPKGGGGRRPSAPSAMPDLRVISIPRATNVGIFLRKVGKLLTVDQLCGAVLGLQDKVLEPELLEAVIANLPAEPEAKALRALKNVEPSTLAPPERFCYEMARLPRLRPMLHALKQRHLLPQSLERATKSLATVAEAASQLMASAALRRILASLLAHGNFLNAGTPRAGAKGIKLEGLDKARSVKSVDGKLTLLEHACSKAGLMRAAVIAELGSVRPACKLPLLDVIRIIQELEEGVDAVGEEIALCPLQDLDAEVAADATGGGPTGDEHVAAVRFRAAMAPFHAEMRTGLDELTARRDETRTLLKRLAGWLGEDPNQANPDAILKVCADLVDTATACAAVPAEDD